MIVGFMYIKVFKRIIDFTLSLLLVLILLPFLIVIIIWLQIANKGGGAFFTPVRPGKNQKLFKVIKFKSMTDEKDENGDLLPDYKRLTRIGRFVRVTSIDELPQLFNVLIGDMSFVGPRPFSVINLPYYNEEEKHRHDVRPGITGMAQANGRTSLPWDQRLAYDIEYVNNVSFWGDIKILFQTVYKVLKRADVGVDKSDFSTFPEYREAQWAAEGRQDLIEKARKELEPYLAMIEKMH